MKSLCLILLLALCTTSCSSFTAAGRQKRVYAKQERAYAKYLKKMRNSSGHQQAKVVGPKMPPLESMTPSEPRESTQMAEEGPQAIPTDSENQANVVSGNN